MTTIDLTKTYGIDTKTYIDEIIRGDTYSRSITVTGLDLTNYIGRCHWLNVTWDTPGTTNDNVVFSSNNNIAPTDLDVPNLKGTYTITIPATESATLAPRTIIYGDLEINNGSGSIITVARFQTKVRGDSSRD